MRVRFCGFVLLVSAIFGMGADLSSLYENRQWFELREATAGDDAPSFYGAIAACTAGLGEVCEKRALAFITSDAPAQDRCNARDVLFDRYAISGRYSLALQQLEAKVRECGEKEDPQNLRSMFRAWAEAGDLGLPTKPVARTHTLYRNGFIGARLDGKGYRLFVDTGANISVIAESAVERLGLRAFPVSSKFGDVTGAGIEVRRVAIAKLRIGNSELANVAFVVLPDSAPPFKYWKKGRRAMLGTQVLYAYRTMRWKGRAPRATFELGGPGLADGPSNVSFDGMGPLLRAEAKGRPVSLVLDTGASQTTFWPRFAREFPEAVGAEGKTSFEGLGGSAELPSVRSGAVPLNIGGAARTATGVPILLKGGNKYHHALLGNDVLFWRGEFVLDYGTMRFALVDKREKH